LAISDAITYSDGRKMSHDAVQRALRNLRRRFGWRLWAFALASLIAIACAETSFGPEKSPQDQQAYKSPEQGVGISSAQLNFIPAFGSHVELQGTATIGSWKSRSTDIQGTVALDADPTAFKALFDRIQSLVPDDRTPVPADLLILSVRSPPIGDISVPVMSLHGDSSGMDRDLQSALDVTQYPSIEYVFQKLEHSALQWDPQDRQWCLKLQMLGKLKMAGAGRLIAMDLIVRRDSRRHFLAHAQTALLMSDFGVTRPGALFGLVKASDEVLVVFDLDLVLVDRSPSH
jgi:YceI-like domain